MFCVLASTSYGAPSKVTQPGAFLDEAESMRIKDHERFVQLLAQIHSESPTLTPEERWHLKYLDAYEASLEGNFAAAEMPLRDVIDHSGNPALAAKASSALLTNLAASHRYEEAFTLAHQLTSELPHIQDQSARFAALGTLSQMLNLAGQHDLAVKYAHMMESSTPPGTSICQPLLKMMAALYSAKQLKSSDQELRRTIDTCQSAKEPIVAAAAELILTNLYLEENQPSRALKLLNRITPGILVNHYFPHTLSAQVQRARAYEQLNRDEEARQAALAAVAFANPGDINDSLRDAYSVLYRLAKRHGNLVSALSYYEHYVRQDKRALDDAAAQAMAYQVVQQQVLTRRLESEALAKQNGLLKLQQALDAKAVETSRLYIALLLIGLAAIALWLFRTMRSQRRFKRMATRDGLTGIHNHQHFMAECDRRLRALQKRPGHACLVWIDLDHFKQINDTHGHAIGDAALKHSVAICQHQLRPGDLLGRLGGEEFGILLGDCPRDQAIAIADRIRLAIETHPMVLDGAVVSISASIGVASTTSSGHELQTLCRDADAALYRAKRAGRNRVVADVIDSGFVTA